MTPETLRAALALADGLRQAQQWADAAAAYQLLESQLAGQAAFHHNLALCQLGAGDAAGALAQATRALAAQPQLWQSAIVRVRALKALGQWPEAVQQLRELLVAQPQRGEFALELATLALHELCDAHLARQIVQPWLAHPVHGTDATLTDLMASLYDPTQPGSQGRESGLKINARALKFADRHLKTAVPDSARPEPLTSAPAAEPVEASRPIHKPRASAAGKGGARLRVGLLSPLFQASPVYFFCSGALALLQQDFDLVFISRSRRSDWATEELHAMAAEWVDATDLDAATLQNTLRRLALDVLVDMGGWMDPVGLQALAGKPAPRLYKWVGGQSLSTGLGVFDGYLTDDVQTPPGVDAWYTEPLLRLPLGYVSYNPPPYMPEPVPAPSQAHVLGVVANPVKVSRPFLEALAERIVAGWPGLQEKRLPLVLRFIDRRYQQPAVQARIRQALYIPQQRLAHVGRGMELEFVAPASHLDYLRAVGAVSEMVDTFPYTCGLTTIEALALGVPIAPSLAPREGLLFCERHTLAHLTHLHMPGSLRATARRSRPLRADQARSTLLPPGCPRRNHAALAASLAQIFTHGTVPVQARAFA